MKKHMFFPCEYTFYSQKRSCAHAERLGSAPPYSPANGKIIFPAERSKSRGDDLSGLAAFYRNFSPRESSAR